MARASVVPVVLALRRGAVAAPVVVLGGWLRQWCQRRRRGWRAPVSLAVGVCGVGVLGLALVRPAFTCPGLSAPCDGTSRGLTRPVGTAGTGPAVCVGVHAAAPLVANTHRQRHGRVSRCRKGGVMAVPMVGGVGGVGG